MYDVATYVACAYRFKNPIKFQKTFLNEKRKKRKENKKEKYIIWFDSR